MLKLILWLIYCGSFYPIPGITHIGEITYLIHEIPDDDLSRISLRDGTIAEWKEIFGPPSLQVEDFTNCPTVPWSGSYDPTDLSWSVWMGWYQSTDRLYIGVEREDNDHINPYSKGIPFQLGENDLIEFLIDGDHSGGNILFL